MSIETHARESLERALIRTLKSLGDELLHEGAPALLRVSGSGHVDNILVSFDTPWQETSLRTDNFERKEPFLITESMVAAAMKETRNILEGKTFVDESIVNAIVNGYETQSPYGKMARRASITILSSFVDASVCEETVATFRSIYHTENIRCVAEASLRYQAIRAAFPHERKPHIDSLAAAIGAANEGKLWLPGNPPKIVPVLASHLFGFVQQVSSTPPDLYLLLMALYWQKSEFSS